MKVKERWRPSSVIGSAIIVLLAAGLVAVCVVAIVTELWGEPLVESVGTARPRPVWMAWIATSAGVAVGLLLFTTSARYLYRVARGRVPRMQVGGAKETSRRAR